MPDSAGSRSNSIICSWCGQSLWKGVACRTLYCGRSLWLSPPRQSTFWSAAWTDHSLADRGTVGQRDAHVDLGRRDTDDRRGRRGTDDRRGRSRLVLGNDGRRDATAGSSEGTGGAADDGGADDTHAQWPVVERPDITFRDHLDWIRSEMAYMQGQHGLPSSSSRR